MDQDVQSTLKFFFSSIPSDDSLYTQWKNGQDISLDSVTQAVPFWSIMAVICGLMLLIGLVFCCKGRIFRGIACLLSSIVYAIPLACFVVAEPSQALGAAGILTVLLGIAWFFISNILVYPHMNFFLRLLASYIHLMIVIFPAMMAMDSSETAAFTIAWFLPLAFHIFVFVIPFLPEGNGSSDEFSLNDMVGDEFDDIDWLDV